MEIPARKPDPRAAPAAARCAVEIRAGGMDRGRDGSERSRAPGPERRPLPVVLPVLLVGALFLTGGPVPADPAPRAPRPVLGGLDSLTAATLEQALDRLAVGRAELGFDKLYVEDDTFRLAVVETALSDPLALPELQADLVTGARELSQSTRGLIGHLGALLQVSPGDGVDRAAGPASELAARYRWDALRGPGMPSYPASGGGGERDLQAPSGPGGGRHPGGASGAGPGRGGAADLEASIGLLETQSLRAMEELELAFAAIPHEERNRILVGAPAAWGQEEDAEDKARKGALHFDLGSSADTTGKLDPDLVLDAGSRLDRAALLRAGDAFAGALEAWGGLGAALVREGLTSSETFAPRWSRSPVPIHPEFAELRTRIAGTVLAAWPSIHGWVVIGGPDDGVYPAEVLQRISFLLDLGGNDVYRGRAGSAVGGLARPIGALIDLEGNDLYDAEGRSYALGGAVFGCAALVDLGGNDTYLGDDGSLGAGYFGIGILHDAAGRDRFEGRNLCQGAGAFGLGILVSASSNRVPPGPEIERDVAFEERFLSVPRTGALPVRYDEDDIYRAALQSQGFGSTFGIGLLYDDRGNDVYRAGGRYLHAPLLPHDFQSLSQGFAIGFRPRAAGGVGLLVDEEGNDFYDAEVYAQGASYWYSLGLLFEGGGNDRYLAAQYAQGAGVHLSVGSLWDRGGDDHYVSKNGVVQGTAHDLSVALLLDESGDDVYAVSGGQGVSLTNSFALFVDGQGDDLYATFEGSRGVASYRRGFSGAAIFLDLEGDDRYPPDEDAADGSVWMSSDFAVGIDLDRDVVLPTETVPEIVLTAADSSRAIEELFETASLWEVGSAREKVRRARLALVARGEEAVLHAVGATGPYPEGEPLASQSGLVYRTLRELAQAHPTSFADRLIARLRDPHDQVQKNVIALLGDMKWEGAREPLEALLEDPGQERHWTRTIQALGKLGLAPAASAIRPFATDPSERRRIVTLEALKLLEDSTSVPLFVAALADPVFTVRSAGMSGLVSIGEHAVEPLVGVVGSRPAGLDRASAVRTLGRLGQALRDSTSGSAPVARERIRAVLLEVLEGETAGGAATVSAHPAVAAAALQGLLRFDPSLRDDLEARFAGGGDPLLRRIAERSRAERSRTAVGP